MKSFRIAVLLCLSTWALGAFAHQASTQAPGQMPQAPGTASQNSQVPNAQSPQATPPYSPSQTQPGAAQSPEAQTPQADQSQAPPMRSGASAVDEQVNALTEALNLTADQQTRIRSILEDQHQQAVGVINDPSLSHDAKLQKVHALRQSTIDKVRGTLSSDDQKSKFDSMIQASNERLRQREQQEQQQNNTPPPK